MSGEILQLLVQRNKIDVKAYFSEGTIGKETMFCLSLSLFTLPLPADLTGNGRRRSKLIS